MRRNQGRWRWWAPALAVGLCGAALSLALGWVLYDAEVREVERRLDVAGQQLVEDVHRQLLALERDIGAASSLLALDPPRSEVEFDWLAHELLEALDGAAYLRRNGAGDFVVTRDWAGWPNGVGTEGERPLDRWAPDLIQAAVTGEARYLPPLPDDPRVVIAQPIRAPGALTTDALLIGLLDLQGLIAATGFGEAEPGPEWQVDEVRGQEEIRLSERLLHREYLILGDRRWLFSLSPRPGTAYSVEWGEVAGVVAAGVAASAVGGLLFQLAFRRRRLQRALVASQQMNAEKDRFLLTVSHQIRTPLTAVVGFLNILRTHHDLTDEERREFLRQAADQADEVSAIVHDILVATRDDLDALVVTAEPTNPVRQAKAVVEALSSVNRPIEVSPEPDQAPLVLADPIRLRQIIRNLVTNALRHATSSVSISCHRLRDQVVLTVADDGPGLGADTGRPPPAADGLGLGLRVAELLVQRMNGRLEHRRSGSWTLFEVTLPGVPASMPLTSEPGSPPVEARP